jgi:hypothetical protein
MQPMSDTLLQTPDEGKDRTGDAVFRSADDIPASDSGSPAPYRQTKDPGRCADGQVNFTDRAAKKKTAEFGRKM